MALREITIPVLAVALVAIVLCALLVVAARTYRHGEAQVTPAAQVKAGSVEAIYLKYSVIC